MTWEEISGAFTKQFVPKLQVGAGSGCWLAVGLVFSCGHMRALAGAARHVPELQVGAAGALHAGIKQLATARAGQQAVHVARVPRASARFALSALPESTGFNTHTPTVRLPPAGGRQGSHQARIHTWSQDRARGGSKD